MRTTVHLALKCDLKDYILLPLKRFFTCTRIGARIVSFETKHSCFPTLHRSQNKWKNSWNVFTLLEFQAGILHHSTVAVSLQDSALMGKDKSQFGRLNEPMWVEFLSSRLKGKENKLWQSMATSGVPLNLSSSRSKVDNVKSP